MSTIAFDALDLKNYAGMARRMFPPSLGLVICDFSGELLSCSDDRVVDRTVKLSRFKPNWPEHVDGLERIDVPDAGTVLVMDLQSGADPTTGFLLWWIADSTPGDQDVDLHDALHSLGVCLRNELELQTELDTMALELSERYEELNLVYHTEDQVSFFREGHEAFRALVQNCSDYLNADLAILYLPNKGVMVSSESSLDKYDMRLIQSLLEDHIYDQVVDRQDIEFLNNESEFRESASAPIPYRLMAGPIVTFADQTDGVLVIANFLSADPFSNSDKNLLTVMSRKAAKIIQGSYDGLTGLLNRTSFEHLVTFALEGLRSSGGQHCLLHINIDKLHRMNETIGHDAGDAVIQAFGSAIIDELRDADTVARLGGDEFGVLVHNCSSEKGEKIAQKIAKAVAEIKILWHGEPINTTVSIGVAALTEASRDGEQVMKHAVTACEVVKESGGNAAQRYESEDTRLMEREANMWMVGTVHAALREGRFMLYGQPILPLSQEGRAHIEILLRMLDGDKIVSPNAFLPASERYQMMIDIDRWVVENSLREIAAYLDTSPDVKPVFGINLSGQSFCTPDFLEFTIGALRMSRVPADLICFEITETAAVSNMGSAQEFITAIRAEGCEFALDDFGAGLSSFGYLKSFDVQYLKIDGALVRDIADDKINAAMVESVNQIGHVMGLKTIAEFVETPQARAMLAKIGVDYIQGYLIGKPAPLLEQLAEMNRKPALSAL
ncbi:MAG: putative bifunctional diguanylate cyclase/phosphodiesterase [Gammaproteobacteria bacterium]